MANPIHVRLDNELEQAVAHEMEATGWNASEVVRYGLRRAFQQGMTPREAGAKEGYFAALQVIKEAMGRSLTDVFERVMERLG